ncbi:related to rab geranylgeranyl transferase component A [Rhynchosporium graminicola]|uniref:Rab proteins geranylgeranyltransferase n=1 Tax=Rhynchosporium graminicola TaxID=2792576 RepID=A0A1E1LRL1_9HELO|nr:related to rab geranylgeranyl transferase component A [Rhynchosporium commune]
MESISDTKWDLVISGTGLQHSLLALALSRSDKKVLHVDQNEYYGGAEAAFSLQEVDEWVEKVNGDAFKTFRNASLWKTTGEPSQETRQLSFSRAYTLTLSAQIIYTKSKLLSQLVSSKVYRQLEFQAVGNWWILDGEAGSALKRLPSGREDIFQDKSIDNRAKRSLMKFLKFVVDYENQPETWQSYSDSGLAGFLSSQFQFPQSLQTVIAALTLSLNPPDKTKVQWALPRIARHLTSLGVFGPGFGAVVPKWGGGAEISQVACRAGAVGGGVYVLGTGVKTVVAGTEDTEDIKQRTQVHLTNGEVVTTQHLIETDDVAVSDARQVSKAIAIVSSPLSYLFKSTVEGSPLAAVSVMVIPPHTLTIASMPQLNPIYIMVHSSETGECPSGQCILYATTLYSDISKELIGKALSTFLQTAQEDAELLYSLYYEQRQSSKITTTASEPLYASLDLAFNDGILDEVEAQWRKVVGDVEEATFMRFEDREGMNAYDDDEPTEDF